MISARMRRLFQLSIILFIAHGVEEYTTGFQEVNPSVTVPAQYFKSIQAGIFVVFQLLLWMLLLVVLAIAVGGRRPLLWVLTVVGIILVTEVHHLIAALSRLDYYPGLGTALLFPVLAFAYWKELLAEWRASRKAN